MLRYKHICNWAWHQVKVQGIAPSSIVTCISVKIKMVVLLMLAICLLNWSTRRKTYGHTCNKLKKQSLWNCCCSFVDFQVPVLHSGYLFYYTALSQVVPFVKDCAWLLECSPESCLAPRNHCEEKRKKFITRRINNKSCSLFSFDACRLKSWQEHIYSFRWMKNGFSREKASSFEKTLL